nr:MAG TPA: hypothetical protein [Crassvirales sp.]
MAKQQHEWDMEELEQQYNNEIAKEAAKGNGKGSYNLVADVMTQASSTL